MKKVEDSVNGIFTLTVKGIILLLLALLAFTKPSINQSMNEGHADSRVQFLTSVTLNYSVGNANKDMIDGHFRAEQRTK